MDAGSKVYAYSPLQTEEAWKPSLFHRAHQSIIKSHLVVAFVVMMVMLLSFIAGGTFVYIYSGHYHNAFEQAHQMDVTNASHIDKSQLMKQNLMHCFHTIEAINFTISTTGKSRAHLLQLKGDIQREIASLQLKNESLIPHNRRRPSVDTWNT